MLGAHAHQLSRRRARDRQHKRAITRMGNRFLPAQTSPALQHETTFDVGLQQIDVLREYRCGAPNVFV
jgi:hypothetical protein